MDAAQLLRDARWHAGLSQRQLAAGAGVHRRVVEDAEAGRRPPRSDVLAALLRVCGLELVSRPVPLTVSEQDERAVAAHLHLSLAARIAAATGGPCGGQYAHQGGPLWRALCQAASACGVVAALDGPLAAAAWLPGVVVPREQLVLLPAPRLGLLRRDAELRLDVAAGRWPDELVSIRLPGPARGRLLVPPPSRLADDADDARLALLSIAARLLHDGAPRDDAGRRPPAHARPDEEARVDRILQRYDGRGRRAPMPSVLDSQTWRLGVEGSVEADVARRGLRRYPAKPGWSRWGW